MTSKNNSQSARRSKRNRFLAGLAGVVVKRPKSILIGAALLTVVASVFIPDLEIVTDRGGLVDSEEPAQRRYAEVSEMLGSLSMAVVVLEGPEREPLRRAADELAERLEGDEQVRSIFYRLDMGFFHERALLYLTEEQLECVEFAVGPRGMGGAASGGGEPGLAGFISGVQQQVETASADVEIPEACQGVDPLTLMERLFAEIGAWVRDPDRETIAVIRDGDIPAGSPSPGQYGVDEEGYLIESDQAGGTDEPHLVFMLIQPSNASGDEAVARSLTESLREVARDVARRHEVRAGVTGMPAIITDEMDAVHRDVKMTITTAIIFVLLLFLATFRSLRATALVALPLVLGLVWTAGFAIAYFTYLTMVSVYFAAVLFGLGIAFGIHLLARFDEGLRAGEEPKEAVRYTMLGAGPGIVTGGVTTAAAFFAVGFCDFQAFAQLGVVAGAGVVAILIASLTVMPVSLYLWRGDPLPEPKTRNWLGEFGRLLTVHSTPILVVAAILTAGGFYGASTITFDYDFSKLLPAEAEALRYYRVMGERSSFSSDIAISLTDSLEGAEERRQQLEELDTVARAEAVTKYLPGSLEEQRRRVARIEAIGNKAREPLTQIRAQAKEALESERDVDSRAVATALQGLGDSVEDAWFAAQQTKRPEAPRLMKLSKTVRASAEAVRETEGAEERLRDLELKMFGGLERGVGVLLANFESPQPLTPSDLPANVRERFVTQHDDGSTYYAVYAYPTGRVGDREFLERFYPEIVSVDPEITGFPVTHYFHGELAKRAFFQAAAYAAIATLLLLAFDFRRFRDVLFAVIPLGVGSGFMLGLMALLGWRWNFVNVVALPLVFGAGVDFGVHLVHRFRQEGDAVKALRTTGRPVILSAVTTLVGMGGLALAEHRGAASLGWLLVLGIGFCLVSAALVLPAAMAVWSRRATGDEADAESSGP